MRKKFGREIALLMLPVLLLGGVALWNGRVGSWSGWGAPLGLLEGAPRLEVRNWQKGTPTAVDFARGISSRWVVTTWNGGTCPTGRAKPINAGMEYPHHLIFAWKRQETWHKMPIPYPQSELDAQNFMRREHPAQHEVRLGLPLDLVPHDAEEVRLQGRLHGWMSCQSGSVEFPSAPLDVLVKAPQEAWPQFSGSRAPVLKFRGAKQEWLYPNLVKNPYANYLKVEATFSYSGRGINSSLSEARSWVTDSKGKYVVGVHSNEQRATRNGVAFGIWSVGTRHLAGKTGPFILHSWVFVDENEWPLQVAIPLNLAKAPKPVR